MINRDWCSTPTRSKHSPDLWNRGSGTFRDATRTANYKANIYSRGIDGRLSARRRNSTMPCSQKDFPASPRSVRQRKDLPKRTSRPSRRAPGGWPTQSTGHAGEHRQHCDSG